MTQSGFKLQLLAHLEQVLQNKHYDPAHEHILLAIISDLTDNDKSLINCFGENTIYERYFELKKFNIPAHIKEYSLDNKDVLFNVIESNIKKLHDQGYKFYCKNGVIGLIEISSIRTIC